MSEMLRSRTKIVDRNKIRSFKNLLNKGLERREIVQEIPGSSSQTLNIKNTVKWQVRADKINTIIDNRIWKYCCMKQA